jgi:flagellar basal-body rod protein FlgC
MDYQALFEISAAGMGVERKRLEIATLNLANMHSSAPAGSVGYQPMRVVAHAMKVDFGNLMDMQLGGVQAEVVPTGAAPRRVQDPGHPHADAQGNVHYPAVDQASEMIVAMTALRAYEANVAAVGFARAMASHALEIGGSR